MTRYAGLDVHKRKCQGVIMDEDGEILKEEKFENSLLGVEDFFRGYEDVEVVIEASYSWRPTYERLEEMSLEVKLAHPHRVRAIAESEIKTDSADARILAHLLRTGLLPESYIPSEKIRELRDKTRLRTKLVRERARLKTMIRAELEKNRITVRGNPFTKKGREELEDMEIESVTHYLAVMETLDDWIGIISNELEDIAEEMEEAKLLMTVPGIGYFSALTILAEISEIDRFPDPENLCSYAGLVSKVHQSGDKKKLGGIKKKSDKLLRWILIESTWIHVGNADSKISKYYHRKKEEKDSKRAAIAAARKMLTAIYYMLKRGEKYRPEG